MKERPILFSGPMVRALLAGTKVQTRRIVKPQPKAVVAQPGEGKAPSWAITNRPPKTGVMVNEYGNEGWLHCPYGYAGDRLWVREAWSAKAYNDLVKPSQLRRGAEVVYPADGLKWGKVRPAIFMPRELSRITLEIVSIRVERLQDISEEDAVAEGLEGFGFDKWGELHHPRSDGKRIITYAYPGLFGQAVRCYERLWDSINGKKEGFAWRDNPWVFVIEFRRVIEESAVAQ